MKLFAYLFITLLSVNNVCTITVSAQDDAAISHLQLLINGIDNADTYQGNTLVATWNLQGVAVGGYTLTGVATDTNNQTGTATLPIKVVKVKGNQRACQL